MPKISDLASAPVRANGWGAVARRQTELAEIREKSGSQVRDFYIKSGESAVIQFLQDEPYCFDAHQVQDAKGNWQTIPCQLNTGKHCVLCSKGVKQTWKAAFKILDYRGTWNKEKGCFNNDEPIVKIWKVGSTVAQQLKNLIDKKKKDLTEMVIEVSKSGSGTDTTYNFEIAFDEKTERRMEPISFKDETPSCEELCAPPTDSELE